MCHIYTIADEELIQNIKEYYKWALNSLWWVEKLATYKKDAINEIQIDGKMITYIASECRYNERSNNSNPTNPKWFRDFLCYVYDMSYEDMIQKIKQGSRLVE